MKFAIVVLAVVAVASAQYKPFQPSQLNQYQPQFSQNRYKPAQYNTRYNPTTFRPYVSSTPAPVSFAPIPSTVAPRRPYNTAEGTANIVKYSNEASPDGSYAYYYETDNGIAAQEQGTPRNYGGNPPAIADVAQGSFSYTSPEGIPVSITYVADENGFQPTGNVLPVAPEIPPQIARALAYIASKY